MSYPTESPKVQFQEKQTDVAIRQSALPLILLLCLSSRACCQDLSQERNRQNEGLSPRFAHTPMLSTSDFPP